MSTMVNRMKLFIIRDFAVSVDVIFQTCMKSMLCNLVILSKVALKKKRQRVEDFFANAFLHPYK